MNRKAGKKKSNTPVRLALNVETEDFIAKLEEKIAMLGEKGPGIRGEETLSPIPYPLATGH